MIGAGQNSLAALQLALERSIIYDQLAGSRPPPILYHYTSLSSLLLILSENSLISTDYRYMNDPIEFKHGREMADRAFEKAVSSTYQEIEDINGVQASELDSFAPSTGIDRSAWLKLAYDIRNHPGPDVSNWFICSFCEDGDRLNQFRLYSNPKETPISIGFWADKLEEMFGRIYGDGLVSLLRCSYGSSEEIISTSANTIMSVFRSSCLNLGIKPSDGVEILKSIFYERTFHRIFSMKPAGFREEEEWRLLIRQPKDSPINSGFRVGKYGLTPFIKTTAKSSLPIARIVLGPTSSNEALHVESMEGCLRQFGYPSVVVDVCSHKIR